MAVIICKSGCTCKRHTISDSRKEILRTNGKKNKGKVHTEEHKAKVSAGNKGKVRSPESKAKYKDVALNREVKYRGKGVCLEGCECGWHSGNGGRACQEGCECGRHNICTEAQREARSKTGMMVAHNRHSSKDTAPELECERRLQEQGLRYEKQFRVGRMTVDFYLPQHNLVVEVDGCWWHGCKDCCPTSLKEDKFEQRHQKLAELGYDSIRIWEHDLK